MIKRNRDHKFQFRFSLIKKISWFLKKTDILFIVIAPPLISLIFLVGSAYIFEALNSAKMPDSFLATIGAIAAFISGFSGLAQIIRQEAPGIMGIPVRGPWAVYTGLIWLAICWVSCVLLIYLAFVDL